MSAIHRRTTLRRLVIAMVALLATFLGGIPAAQAHDYLVGSTPKPNSTVSAPLKQVSLEFNDIVLTRPAPPQLTVRGPGGRYYETGCATVSDATVDVPVALGGAGKYTVTWRIVSADGHPVSDSISFTYHPKSGATAAKGSSGPRACTGSASSAASAAPRSTSSDGGAPTGAIVAVVIIAVVGVAGAALIVLARGRRQGSDETEQDDFDDED